MQKSFWSNWFKPATASSRKWTLEELGELYDVLLRNGVVTEHNRAMVVETIRTIAEYILWGDQNEPRIFDFFLENNILTYLHKVLLQPSNRTGEVAKQVLQTLSIIIQNVRSETGIFFLFSNNHINNIVDLDFDFSDEEVLGYYISFLKTISLKLNTGTVHFFLNSSSTGRGFPLYTRAIRLAHNREGMVRAAVRTLTLNVFSVPDPDIISFVSAPPACQYFSDVAHYLADQVQLLDRHLAAAEAGGAQALGSLDSQLAETEDVLSYISDLLSLGVPSISQLLASSLWQWVVRPLLLRPLMQAGAAGAAQQAAAAATPASSTQRGSLHRNSSGSRGIAAGTPVGSPRLAPAAAAAAAGGGGGHYRHWSWGSGSWGPEAAARQAGPGKVRPVCAVYVLERVFLLVSYQPLLQQLLLALTCGVAQQQAPSNSSSSSSHPLQDSSSSSSRADNSSSSGSSAGSSCRACLLAMLQSGQPLPVLLVLRLLVAMLNSKHLQPELLIALSLLPRKHLQQQGSKGSAGSSSLEAMVQLLHQQLQVAAGPVGAVAPGAMQQAVMGGTLQPTAAGDNSSDLIPQQADLLLLLTEQYLPKQSDNAGANGSSSDGSSGTGSSSSRVCEYLRSLDEWGVQAQQQQQQTAGDPPSAAAVTPGSIAFAGFGPQLLSSLMQLLQLCSMPPLGLWLLGWLLHQLLPVSAVTGATAAAATAGGAAASHHQHRLSQSIGGEGDDSNEVSGWGFGADGSSSSSGSDSLSRSNSGSSVGRPSRRSRQGQVSSSIGGATDLQQPSSATDPGLEPAPPMPPLSTTRAVSVQSSLGFEPRASLLNPEQQHLLQEALDAAHAVFGQQLSSMWCEAVFPLLGVEWPICRDMMLRPVMRASSADLMSGRGVWPVLRALQEQQRQQQQGVRQPQQGEGQHSASAQAALECYLAVQRVVALTQVQELLSVGCVAFTPPVPTVSESDLKQVDIQEGYQVDLAPGSALPCVVSFAPGQERRVYFAVAGLSQQQMAALQGPSEPAAQQVNSTTSSTPGATRNTHSLSGTAAAAASGGGVHHGSLLRSLPVAVLADPSPSRPQAGVVLSVAPLLGARPYTDPQVGKWLHVHVRPSVRGLLRVIKTSSAKQGGLLAAMRQLADGHWVLAFSSGDKAALAVTLVQQHAARLQALYGDALAPMCGAVQQLEPQQAEAEPAGQQSLQQQQQQQQQQEPQQLAPQQQAEQEPQSQVHHPMQQSADDPPQQQQQQPQEDWLSEQQQQHQQPAEQLPEQPALQLEAPQQQQQQQVSPVEGTAIEQAAAVSQTSDLSADVQQAGVQQVTDSIAQASLADSAERSG